jgi:hypothetical protein
LASFYAEARAVLRDPHTLVWMVVVEGATHGQAALFREWAPA